MIGANLQGAANHLTITISKSLAQKDQHDDHPFAASESAASATHFGVARIGRGPRTLVSNSRHAASASDDRVVTQQWCADLRAAGTAPRQRSPVVDEADAARAVRTAADVDAAKRPPARAYIRPH